MKDAGMVPSEWNLKNAAGLPPTLRRLRPE